MYGSNTDWKGGNGEHNAGHGIAISSAAAPLLERDSDVIRVTCSLWVSYIKRGKLSDLHVGHAIVTGRGEITLKWAKGHLACHDRCRINVP
jgi:hypothetical protein